jgi:hypothetical protein
MMSVPVSRPPGRLLGPITGAELAHAKDWKKVMGFSLGFSKVSDEGLAHLEGWENLSCLHLESTPVMDTGLAHLAGLKKLSALQVVSTKVIAICVDVLQRALPKCKIEWQSR